MSVLMVGFSLKFPLVYRTLLSILADLISPTVWMVSILLLLISSSPSLFSKSMGDLST